MFTVKFGKTSLAAALLSVVIASAANPHARGRVGDAMRVLEGNYRTIEGDRPALNTLNKLLLGVILSNQGQTENKKGRRVCLPLGSNREA